MKKLAIMIFCCLFFAACSESETDTELNGDRIYGVWVMESFEDLVTNEVTIRTEENSWGLDVTVTFDDDVEPHQITGEVTTNTVFGEFEYLSNNTFEVKSLGTTLVSQPEWGNKFGQAMLDGILEYEVTNNRLIIHYDDHEKKLTMIRESSSKCLETVPTNEACRAYFERWFYNVGSKSCEKISYSGCSQKGFSTQEECLSCKCK